MRIDVSLRCPVCFAEIKVTSFDPVYTETTINLPHEIEEMGCIGTDLRSHGYTYRQLRILLTEEQNAPVQSEHYTELRTYDEHGNVD